MKWSLSHSCLFARSLSLSRPVVQPLHQRPVYKRSHSNFCPHSFIWLRLQFGRARSSTHYCLAARHKDQIRIIIFAIRETQRHEMRTHSHACAYNVCWSRSAASGEKKSRNQNNCECEIRCISTYRFDRVSFRFFFSSSSFDSHKAIAPFHECITQKQSLNSLFAGHSHRSILQNSGQWRSRPHGTISKPSIEFSVFKWNFTLTSLLAAPASMDGRKVSANSFRCGDPSVDGSDCYLRNSKLIQLARTKIPCK